MVLCTRSCCYHLLHSAGQIIVVATKVCDNANTNLVYCPLCFFFVSCNKCSHDRDEKNNINERAKERYTERNMSKKRREKLTYKLNI